MGKISNSTLNKVLLRTQGCQFAHNYERMQSLSLTYCFAPVLEELYKDAPKEERVNAMKRHLEYFTPTRSRSPSSLASPPPWRRPRMRIRRTPSSASRPPSWVPSPALVTPC